MHDTLKKSIITVFYYALLFMPALSVAQDSLSTIPYDSSHIEIRTADQDYFNEITNEDVFDYQQKAENTETFWSRIQRWLFQNIISILDNKWASFFIKLIFFAIFGFVLVALINQILGGNIQSAFSSKKKSRNISLKANEILFEENDLGEMLQNAISENRFSDAVRILYLQTLKELNGAGLIHLKPDKTNHDYLQELGQHSATSAFSRLTLFYEYVEYGDFKIDEAGYQKVQQIHQQFKEQIIP